MLIQKIYIFFYTYLHILTLRFGMQFEILVLVVKFRRTDFSVTFFLKSLLEEEAFTPP